MIKILKEIVIICGLAVIFLVGYWVLNPGQKRIVKKARRLHRKGEKYYLEGDKELADEYYTEAETLRKTAREMA